MKKTKAKKERGITLIALVITIIVLLILAAVSIATLTGENGILTKASTAVMENSHAEVYETLLLETQTYRIELEKGVVKTDLSSYFKDKGILTEDNIVNVEKLLDKKAKYGKGTDGATDIYKLELDEESIKERYDIVYYGADAIGVIIGEIKLSSKGDVSGIDIFTYADEAKTILTGVNEKYVKYTEDIKSSVDPKTGEATKKLISAYYNVIDEKGNIVNEITIPEGVVEIANEAFMEYTSLIINMPASVKKVGDYAFYGECVVNVEGKYSERQFESVGENAFNCIEVNYLDFSKFFEYEDEAKTILKGIKSEYLQVVGFCSADYKVGDYHGIVDEYGDAINKIVIPENVKEISDVAFLGFRDLITYVPSSVMSIGEMAFYYSDTVYIEGKSSAEDFINLGEKALSSVTVIYLGND